MLKLVDQLSREYFIDYMRRNFISTAGIEKISLTVVQTNTKAIQLYKRYGFVEEGLLIKDRIHKDGNYYNTVIMGRLLDK